MTSQGKTGCGFTFGSTDSDGNGLRVAVSTAWLPYPNHTTRTMKITVGKLTLFSGIVDESSVKAAENMMMEVLDGNPSELAGMLKMLSSLMPELETKRLAREGR